MCQDWQSIYLAWIRVMTIHYFSIHPQVVNPFRYTIRVSNIPSYPLICTMIGHIYNSTLYSIKSIVLCRLVSFIILFIYFMKSVTSWKSSIYESISAVTKGESVLRLHGCSMSYRCSISYIYSLPELFMNPYSI